MILELFAVNSENPLSEETFYKFLNFADCDKKNIILKQKKKHNADNSLIGIVLAKAALQKVFGLSLSDIHFVYDQNGKPHLSTQDKIHFSISHSHNLVVCAVSNVPVGIDVEQIRTFNPALAKKYFSSEEKHRIESSSDPNKAFTAIWTQKEAILKLHGTGISGLRDTTLSENCTTESIVIENYCISTAILTCPHKNS